MKKIFPLLFIALAAFSCQKEPDTGKLDADFVVLTNHDTSFDFGQAKTYYVPDSVLVIGKNENQADYWVNENSEQIINAFVDNMRERGFELAPNKESADYGLQISFVEDTSYFLGSSYPAGSPWWGYYPGYWAPGFWGGYWGGYYYPYPIMYRYNVGVMLADLLDLKAPVNKETSTENKIPVVWNAYMGGLLFNSKFNLSASLNSINQAFEQSPYLKTSAQK